MWGGESSDICDQMQRGEVESCQKYSNKVFVVSILSFGTVVNKIWRVCVSGAFLQHGVWPGARRGPLWDAGWLLGGLQSLLRHFLFLPDDGDLPHRREVQSGLQSAHTQRVRLKECVEELSKLNHLNSDPSSLIGSGAFQLLQGLELLKSSDKKIYI